LKSPLQTLPRIIFLGTPEFAVASLDALLKAGYSIVAVITAPDKPAGRGLKLTESAVKQYAREKGLPVLQPEKLKNDDFLEELKRLKADLQVVVAFRMLPESVWNMPAGGTINLHGSLLPNYRGAAPINWALINGERETGVTTFKLRHEIDTGDILLQESILIEEDETAGELHDRMKTIGAALLVKSIGGLLDGTVQEVSQHTFLQGPGNSDQQPTIKQAPKIYTGTCKINWATTVDEVYNLVRGLSPYPAAFTHLDDKLLKIYRAEKQKISPDVAPGIWQTDNKNFLRFACLDGWLYVKEGQLKGKKKMGIEEFLRGYRV